jgi:hypothetical protein
VTASTRRRAAQAAAGGIVFAVVSMPALMIWWAGSNGSLGDLSEIELLGVGLVIALGAGAIAMNLVGRALDLAACDPRVGSRDPWAALFVATIILSITATLVPAIGLLVLLPDENTPLGSRVHWLAAVWLGGCLLAGAISIWGARKVLVRHR